jgi:hypothetical protein
MTACSWVTEFSSPFAPAEELKTPSSSTAIEAAAERTVRRRQTPTASDYLNAQRTAAVGSVKAGVLESILG